MDIIPKDLLIDIVSRLDSDDVARCRVASKIFDDAYSHSPHLRSIKLHWKIVQSSSENRLKKQFMNLISNMRVVESVCIGIDDLRHGVADRDDYFDIVTNEDLLKEWLPKVSENLKSLSLTDSRWHSFSRRSNKVLQLVSTYCDKLVELKVKEKDAWLSSSVHTLNPMTMLTSLTLDSLKLCDQKIAQLNTSAPNLQVLNLVSVRGLKDPNIHLLNLRSSQLITSVDDLLSLSLIAPKLITLRLEVIPASKLSVEAPILSRFHIYTHFKDTRMSLTKFENLKHLSVKHFRIGTLLNDLTTSETVEDLTVDTKDYWPGLANETCKLFTLEKLFTVFPKVTSLCIKSFAWRELVYTSYPGYSPQITDGTKGLKKLSAYMNQYYPQRSLSCITHVLDQCTGLSEVSLFIHKYVHGDVLKEIVAKCEAHCRRLNWRRGMWNGGTWLVVQGLLKDTSTYV